MEIIFTSVLFSLTVATMGARRNFRRGEAKPKKALHKEKKAPPPPLEKKVAIRPPI